ncbi:LuxR family two component transcriptional regulator [Nocardioides sp. J9]|uniref:response regulator transcription factor n=1 Tax=unclassified Nocardioides TaxID=2615069 RepID=UPI0004BA228A|nr:MULTISPECIES: response regulator transcription factor [unclassified Nocardioides]TWG95600.1 LuxR family two component transcriptional regulator [Nocardioides sp. J9]
MTATTDGTPDATPTPIRVFLVDDQELVRAGFRMLIDSEPDLTVVGEAGDGSEALQRLAVTGCDVVLMDVRMPRLDGVEATRRLAERPGAPQVVVLTTFDLDEYAFAAIRAGAAAFLLKDATPDTLLGAIRTVHAGDSVVAPSTTRRLLEHFASALPAPGAATGDAPAPDERLATLTDRERETLVLVGRGLSNSEIAAEFVVSEATVKTHIGRLLAKTGSRDRVQLVVLAYETGLVRPQED